MKDQNNTKDQHSRPHGQQQQQQRQREQDLSLAEGLPLVLEPLQVTADEISERSPADSNIANTENAIAAGADPTTQNMDCNDSRTLSTNKTTTTTKYDSHYDPLPLAKEQRHMGEYDSSAQGTGVTGRRQQILEDEDLYYDSFSHHNEFQRTEQQQQQQQHQDALTFVDRTTRCTSVDHNMNNKDSSLMIEPASEWLNPSTYITNNTNNTIRQEKGRCPTGVHPVMNEYDSNPIPIQQTRFHSIQQLQDYARDDSKQQEELGQSSGSKISKNKGKSNPMVCSVDERKGMVDSFQGRHFYPPQPMMPPPISPHQHQLTRSTTTNFSNRSDSRFNSIQQVSQTVRGRTEKGPSHATGPILQRDMTPNSTSIHRKEFAQSFPLQEKQKDKPMQFAGKEQIQDQYPSTPLDSATQKRKRSRHVRCCPNDRQADTNNRNCHTGVLQIAKRTTKTKLKSEVKMRQPRGGDTYILRIHEMLEEANREGFDHIVSWQPHGRAFKIHSLDEFSEKIMPRYFETKKWKSFQRWLNAWGFVRHCEGKDRGAYYHRYFVRGVVVSLVKKLTREEMLKSMEGWPAPGEVPNFYNSESEKAHGKSASDLGKDCSVAKKDVNRYKKDGCEIQHINEHDKSNPSSSCVPARVDEIENKNHNKLGIAEKDDASIILYENPKLLRGTILEDVRRMLQDAIEKNFTDVVSWIPGGKAFKIYDAAAFQDTVCGTYFNTSKLSSFSDTLRTWGFCRLRENRGEERNAYYHRLFQEGKPHLCRHHSRTQMLKAMENFREEQKRQKDLSWSLFPRRTEEQQRGNKSSLNAMTGVTPKILEPKHSDTIVRGNDITGDIENDFARAIDQTAKTSQLSKPQDYSIPNFDLPNSTDENRNSSSHGNINSNISEVENSIQRTYRDNGVMYPCYTILPHETIGTIATDPHLTTNDKDTQQPNELPKTVKTNLDKVILNRSPDFKASDDRQTGLSYVLRIHKMLEDVEKNGNSHIISWRPHGRAFKIHDKNKFVSTVLPRYFSASSFTSFSRWLNHWGFLRILSGKDRQCWYHRLFVRGVTELLKDLTQPQLFAAMKEWRAPGKEPDFYCSGVGDALSELPPEEVRKKKKARKIDPETCGEKSNADNGDDIGATFTTTGSKGTTPSHLKPKIDPKYLRGTILESLREMLDLARIEGNTHVVSWLVHGKAFQIYQPKVFEEKIMHRFFRSTKYRYFADTLRSWGFVIIRNGTDKGAFYHKLFVRNEPELCLHLTRTQMKSASLKHRK